MRAPLLRSAIILFRLFYFLPSSLASGSDGIEYAQKQFEKLEQSLEDYRQHAATSADQARHRVPVPDASDKAVWSAYPELKPKDPIKLRISVNIVLIGSQEGGDVLHQITTRAPELWLQYASGILRHATLEQDLRSSGAEGLDGRGGGSPGLSPIDPGVEYAYEFRPTKVGENVIMVIEALLRRVLRKDDGVSSEQGRADGKLGKRMYATTRDMDDLLSSLVSTLNDAWNGVSSMRPPGSMAKGPVVSSPGAFTVFVLNPRREQVGVDDGDVYGYRCGLSRSHMNAVAEDPGVLEHASEVESAENSDVRVVVEALEEKQSVRDFEVESDEELESEAVREEVKKEWLERVGLSKSRRERTRARVIEVDAVSESSNWASDHLRDDSQEVWRLEQEIERLSTRSTKKSPLHPATRRQLLDALAFRRRRVDEGPGDGSDSSGISCLTDAWVSNERFAWVDLQAGPFEWGPAASGIGYKRATSGGGIPHLSPSQARLGGDADGGGGVGGGTEPVDQAYQRSVEYLKGILDGRLKILENIAKQTGCLADDAWNAEHSSLRRRMSATTRAPACEDVLSQLKFLRSLGDGGNFLVSKAGEGTAAASGDFRALQERHLKFLKDVVEIVAPATGGDMDGIEEPLDPATQTFLVRLAEMISSLAGGLVTPVSTLPMTRPAPSTLERSAGVHIGHADGDGKGGFLSDLTLRNKPSWDSQTSEGGRPDRSPPRRLPVDLLQAIGRGAADLTMEPKRSEAALGSRFGIREVPGSGMGNAYPVLSPPPVSALDFFVPETLAFTFKVVRGRHDDRPLGEYAERGADSYGFDLAAFKAGALSLRLPNQRASFTVELVSLDEELSDAGQDSGATDLDFGVASALAAAMRESNVSVNVAGGRRREERIWIDSASFHRQLQARGEVQQGERERPRGNPTYQAPQYPHEITVYLFSLAESKVVYVDEYWRARAVGGDMVIIAQSDATRDTTTRFACGGRGVEGDPRNPVQEALAALGSIVGGLVPSQDRWDEARGGVVPDWRWSMSESPMSPLVPRANFSQLDQDVIYRTHIVRALGASLQLTRAASEMLRDSLSRNDAERFLKEDDLGRLPPVLGSIRLAESHQKTIARYVEKMYFDSAARELNILLDESLSAYDDSRALAKAAFEAVLKTSGDDTGDKRPGDVGVEASLPWRRLVASVVMLILLAALWGTSPKAGSRRHFGGRRRGGVRVN